MELENKIKCVLMDFEINEITLQEATKRILLLAVNFNKMKKQFRKTYRHEVIIEAETKEEAQQIWESISLGKLDQEVADGEIYSHEFVENISFEDENYDDV